MTTEWSLDELYKGFDDPAYGKDVAELTAQIDALTTLVADAGGMQEKERTEKVLAAQSGIAQLFYQLSLYVELRQSVNTEDGTVMAENAKLMKLQAKMAPLEAAAGKLLAGIRDVDALAKESELVREHTFYLKEKQKEAESREISNMIRHTRIADRTGLTELMRRLKGMQFDEQLLAPYMQKLEEKLTAMDSEALDKICENLPQMTADEALEAYQKVDEGIFLPKLKTNALEMLKKRLIKLKTDECE